VFPSGHAPCRCAGQPHPATVPSAPGTRRAKGVAARNITAPTFGIIRPCPGLHPAAHCCTNGHGHFSTCTSTTPSQLASAAWKFNGLLLYAPDLKVVAVAVGHRLAARRRRRLLSVQAAGSLIPNVREPRWPGQATGPLPDSPWSRHR
jgi:hypothetical protein